MPALRSPQDILSTELKEIYSAERQLSRALPRLAKRVSSDRLKEMLEQRVQQGETLIEQLDDALEQLGVSKSRGKNIAAEGLLEDMNQHVEEIQDERLLDPLLLASVQKIEHYCIAAWGTARSMGQLLDAKQVVKTMDQVLKEGKAFDEQMTRLAEEEINPQMMSGNVADEAEGEEAESGNGRSQSRSRSRRTH